MLWVQRPTHEKGADVEIGDVTTRERVGLMADEDALRVGIMNQKPTISVGTAVKFSGSVGVRIHSLNYR